MCIKQNKVIIEKSRGEMSPLEQDSNLKENLNYHTFFQYIKMCRKICHFHMRYMMVSWVKRFQSYEGRKVGHSAQIQPKSQFPFQENLPPRDFSIMTLKQNKTCIFFGTYLVQNDEHRQRKCIRSH